MMRPTSQMLRSFSERLLAIWCNGSLLTTADIPCLLRRLGGRRRWGEERRDAEAPLVESRSVEATDSDRG